MAPILTKLREADFFAVLFDGATDTSVSEQEIIYVRVMSQGRAKNYYLALKGNFNLANLKV